jgi:hypothetical protein
MKEFKRLKYMDLLIPGTHDSSAHDLRNYIGSMRKMAITQYIDIY